MSEKNESFASRIGQHVNAARAVVGGGLLGAGIHAHAALPNGVKAAIETAGEDLVEAGTAVLLAMVGFWAIRKVGQKLGMW